MRNYTVAVDTHKANIEVHATGCRDLAHLPAGTTAWQVIAASAKQLVKDQELTGAKINACCNPKRMDAAGRAAILPHDEPSLAPPVDQELTQAMRDMAQQATDEAVARFAEDKPLTDAEVIAVLESAVSAEELEASDAELSSIE